VGVVREDREGSQEPAPAMRTRRCRFLIFEEWKEDVPHIDRIQVVFESRRPHVIFSSRILTEEGGRKANIVSNTALFLERRKGYEVMKIRQQRA
jgi:hypothetical protein